MAVDLATEFCGLRFKNPLIIPAGTHGRDGPTIREVSGSGVAAICTKTIVAQPSPDVGALKMPSTACGMPFVLVIRLGNAPRFQSPVVASNR